MGSFPIQVLVIEVGARRPLGVSSAGLAILSRLSKPEAVGIVARNAARFAAYRTDQRRVLMSLEATRRRGYALSDPGLVPGTKAISAPIVTTTPNIAAALTVAAVRQRLRPAREAELSNELVSLCAEIAENIP